MTVRERLKDIKASQADSYNSDIEFLIEELEKRLEPEEEKIELTKIEILRAIQKLRTESRLISQYGQVSIWGLEFVDEQKLLKELGFKS